MKFSEFPYVRPDFEAVKAEMEALLAELAAAPSADEFLKVFDKINICRNHYSTASTLSSIRHSINTKDEFYDKENEYWDEYGPLYQNLKASSLKWFSTANMLRS